MYVELHAHVYSCKRNTECFFFFFNFGQSATIIFVLGARQGEVAMSGREPAFRHRELQLARLDSTECRGPTPWSGSFNMQRTLVRTRVVICSSLAARVHSTMLLTGWHWSQIIVTCTVYAWSMYTSSTCIVPDLTHYQKQN